MNLKSLALLLRKAATSLPSQSAELEITEAIDLLERNGQRSVSELVQALAKAWPSQEQTAPFNASCWVEKLRKSTNDLPAFEALLKELAKPKKLKAPEVAAIANSFRSATKTYKSKATAIEDIRKAWMEERRDVAKVRKADEIF